MSQSIQRREINTMTTAALIGLFLGIGIGLLIITFYY